jgi:sentrin-specific protease 1
VETIKVGDWVYEKRDLRAPGSQKKDYKAITEAMHDENLAVLRRNEFDIVVEDFRIPVSQHDLLTLTGDNWVNDHIIEFYLQMVVRRSTLEENTTIGMPRVHAMNTYFYTKLINSGYSSVQNWTKNIDIFSYSLILIPIHLDLHWALVVVDLRVPGAFYYDSMSDETQTLANRSCLTQIINYIKEEHRNKKNGKELEMKNFVREPTATTPQQLNGSDCGLFLCKVAEFLSQEAALNFDQEDMPYFRQRMIWEIAHNQLIKQGQRKGQRILY